MTELCARADECRGLDDEGEQIPPREATDGSYLCPSCYGRFGAAIWDLRDLHRTLESMLSPGGSSGERASGGTLKSERDAIRPAVVEARDQIMHDLIWLAVQVHNTRGIHPPKGELNAICAFLTTHLIWMGNQPDAGDWYGGLADSRGQARRVAYPSGRRTFPVRGPKGQDAPCPELVDDPDNPEEQRSCTGTLVATIYPADDLLPSYLACTVHEEHTVTADQWMTLGRHVLRQEVSA